LSQSYETFAAFASPSNSSDRFLVAERDAGSVLLKWSGNSSTGFLQVQTLPSNVDLLKVSTFRLGSTQYVALPIYFDGSTNNVRCEIFAFNTTTSRLESYQNISTLGVTGVSAIMTPLNGAYLAVSNYYTIDRLYTQASFIMRFNNARQFEHFQNITTNGAFPPEFFNMGLQTYLTIPQQYDGSTFSMDSLV
jgi:hypothetical protein